MKVVYKYGSEKIMNEALDVSKHSRNEEHMMINLSLLNDNSEFFEDEVPCEGVSPLSPIKLPLNSEQACKNKLVQDKGKVKERDRAEFSRDLRSLSNQSGSSLSSLEIIRSDESNILLYDDFSNSKSSIEKMPVKPNSLYKPDESFSICIEKKKLPFRGLELSNSLSDNDNTPQPFRLRKDKLNEMDSSQILSQLYEQKHQEYSSKCMKVYKIIEC